MKFVNTSRFSQVACGKDLPWDEDYFHMENAEITNEFLNSEDYITDEEWWNRQDRYCRNGITVPNAIEPGGDLIVDGEDCFWNEGTTTTIYLEKYQKFLPPNSCYIPNYDLLIKNREVHISGRHYFYLNFWPIYGLKGEETIKSITNPRFLDMDFFFARRIEMQIEQSLDASELKSRQKGFSEKAAGMIAGWNYTFIKASVTIIVAGEETDAEHTMENAIRGLDELRNTQFFKERARGYDSASKIRSKSSKAEIRCLTAKDKPQAVARYSPYWVIYEEVGKWKAGQVIATKGFANPAMEAQGIKTGYATYIGTGGDMDQGAADFEDMHYHPEKNKLLSFENKWESPDTITDVRTGHFTPAYWFNIIDKDGNSYKQQSIEYYQKVYDGKSAKEQYTHQTQFPIYASQAFMINSGGYFGKEIIQLLNLRKAYILTHKEAQIEQVGRLEWINKNKPWEGVKFELDKDGWCVITELPDLDDSGNTYINLYKASTDSYDQDEATTDSMGSCQIWKGFNQDKPMNTARKWVARITERPSTSTGGAELFYEHTAMLCIFYGHAINLIEYSKIRVIDWYIKNKFDALLKERPEFVSAAMITKSKTSNKYGIDPATKPHWLAMLRDEMTADFINRMDDVYQIERLAKFRYDPSGKKYNCDTTITSALNIVLDKDETSIMVSSSSSKAKKTEYTTYVTRNGRLEAA